MEKTKTHIETREELAYVMKFYGIKRVPVIETFPCYTGNILPTPMPFASSMRTLTRLRSGARLQPRYLRQVCLT